MWFYQELSNKLIVMKDDITRRPYIVAEDDLDRHAWRAANPDELKELTLLELIQYLEQFRRHIHTQNIVSERFGEVFARLGSTIRGDSNRPM